MGLTKQYLKYVPAGVFNIIASSGCNIVFVTLADQEGRFVAVGACEHVFIWDMRTGEKTQVLLGEDVEVTCIAANPNNRQLGVGYAHGILKIFDLQSCDSNNTFSGHKRQISALAFDKSGHRVASGGKDNEIIIWDIVADAGICRLSGHKAPITQLTFMTRQNVIISASKDTFIKVWDIDSQHCFKTLVGHKSEVWGICLMKADQYLVTGASDYNLRVWKIAYNDFKSETVILPPLPDQFVSNDDDLLDETVYPVQFLYAGSVIRNGKGRIVSMQSDPSGQVLACHGTDNQLELFYFCSDHESQTRLKKRLKKRLKDNNPEAESGAGTTNNLSSLSLRDEVRRLSQIKLTRKARSLDLRVGGGGEIRVCTTLVNNVVQLHSVTVKGSDEPKCLRSIVHHGHHSEVRAVNFSSDNLAVVSGSADSIKVWNRPSQMCVRTIETTDYVLCLCFVPGDRHVLVGLKNGNLIIADVSVGDILEVIPAHSTELWSICVTPDQRGCVTGAADNTVKFWQFHLIEGEQSDCQAKVLSLLHSRTLKLEDNVLCVKLSENNKFIAVALLDSTAKIFFVDTFKFYLSLYGHKLPILCMDISSDSTIIATGSADRNIKIWGMDFGDCHKSIFAHDDSVMSLHFVPKTHYFFSCGRDGKVKQWNADSFEKIITLPGHIGEAWALAVSPSGKHVLTSGSDSVLRLWEQSDEMLVLEGAGAQDTDETGEELATGEDTVIPGKGVVVLPTKKTVGSEKAAESLLECLEINRNYNAELSESANSRDAMLPAPPALMQAFLVSNADDFLLETLKRIRSSDLEEALLLLPFSSVIDLLSYLPRLAVRRDQVQLVSRVTVFLLRLHSTVITASSNLLLPLKQIEKQCLTRLQEIRDTVGYNLHGLQFLQREVEIAEGVQLFRNLTIAVKEHNKKTKLRQKRKRVIMALR